MPSLFLVVGIPFMVWMISYFYLAIYYKKWNLLHVKIHETGRYSLLGTIFYFNHFLREMIMDTFFVLSIFFTISILRPSALITQAVNLVPVLATFITIVFIGSIWKVGFRNTLLDFFQFRELDTVVSYGSHWQMHFLSNLTLMLMFVMPVTFVGGHISPPIVLTFLLFFVLSGVFKTGPKAVTHPRWLMHGGREIITFFFLALIPAYVFSVELQRLRPTFAAIALAGLLAAILIYYWRAFLKVNLNEVGQSSYGIAYLLASHFFEHVLDVVYMLLLLAVLLSR
ncbi:MAG: hypothetical protein IIC78_12050 [Chloroflexi bacterium]|nr:hypothetical protein [Chloroflexota bacterium]